MKPKLLLAAINMMGLYHSGDSPRSDPSHDVPDSKGAGDSHSGRRDDANRVEVQCHLANRSQNRARGEEDVSPHLHHPAHHPDATGDADATHSEGDVAGD